MSSIFWLLSRAVHLSAFVGLYGEECMCLHVLRMWRAGRVSSYVGRYQEHIMFQDVCLHVLREPGMSQHVSACMDS
jgi:hypothetical protein